MKSVWAKLHEISDKLHLPSLPNWLVGILALVFILRIPSFSNLTTMAMKWFTLPLDKEFGRD